MGVGVVGGVGGGTLKTDKDRREGKGRCCCLGDIPECRANHLAAWIIWKQVFGRTSILVGLWFGLVWNGGSSTFSKHTFHKVAFILLILFFKSSATTFAFSSVCFFFYGEEAANSVPQLFKGKTNWTYWGKGEGFALQQMVTNSCWFLWLAWVDSWLELVHAW